MSLFNSITICDEKQPGCPPEAVRPKEGEGLDSLNNKVIRNKYVTLVNRETGQAMILNNDKTRLRRMQRRIHDWARLLSKQPGRFVMYGLTYRPGLAYKPCDIRNFMSKVKKHFGDKLIGYAWVGELQQRGALHYHVILHLKKGVIAPYPDKKGWWGFGTSSTTIARTPYYLVKYTGKEHQKDFSNFPKGCRVFATWIKDPEIAVIHRYNNLKGWIKSIVDSEGWQAVGFYRKLHKEKNSWVAWSFNKELGEAFQQISMYTDVYKLKEIRIL